MLIKREGNKKRIMKAIKKGRNRKGWSQRKLCEELGVSFSIISKWEIGDKTPAGEVLLDLIEMLDLLPDLFPDYVIDKRDQVKASVNEHEKRLKELEDKIVGMGK